MKKRIFVLDDVELLQSMLKHLLEREGFSVRCFGNPVELLVELADGSDIPALVITDFGMPELHGDEVALNMRMMGDPIASIPVLGLSDSHPEARSAFEAVGIPYLVKTIFHADDIINEVRRLTASPV